MDSNPSFAFIGLGAMGFPMAGHLVSAGFTVSVFNRTRARAEAWATSYRGEIADSPAAAANGADFAMVCVGNDDDVRSVVFGDRGVLAGLAPGATLIDHTTTSAALAEELGSACEQRGIAFVDAPVSGGQAGAENGALTIMAGGKAAHFDHARPVLETYAKAIRLMGPVGAGQLTKMVNQICIAGVLQGLSEALFFAERAGLDINAVVEAISQGAAQSWQMDNRHKTMASGDFDFGFAVDWMRKDLGIAMDAAGRLGVHLPITELVDSFYADVQTLGGGRWDTSSLIERLRQQQRSN
jgi:3-hydroxyisobutyrate dehydrogenase-like beta-hydroxyacid dehydrogenase